MNGQVQDPGQPGAGFETADVPQADSPSRSLEPDTTPGADFAEFHLRRAEFLHDIPPKSYQKLELPVPKEITWSI